MVVGLRVSKRRQATALHKKQTQDTGLKTGHYKGAEEPKSGRNRDGATASVGDSLSLRGSGCYGGVFAEGARIAQGLAIVWPCNHLRGILGVLEARS